MYCTFFEVEQVGIFSCWKFDTKGSYLECVFFFLSSFLVAFFLFSLYFNNNCNNSFIHVSVDVSFMILHFRNWSVILQGFLALTNIHMRIVTVSVGSEVLRNCVISQVRQKKQQEQVKEYEI